MANGHGGKRKNAGRKSKKEELKLIEKLSPMEDVALEKLQEGIESGDYSFIKLYFEYMYGRPLQRMDHTTDGNPMNEIKVAIISATDPVKAEDDIDEDI